MTVALYGIDADPALQPVVPPSLFSGITKGSGPPPDNATPAPMLIPGPMLIAMLFPY
jgi:hypothetical protein